MKSYVFTLTRTRIQSCDVTVQARTAHEAEGLMVDFIDTHHPDSDQLAHDAMAFSAWSDGEDEGQLDYDMDLQTALAADREGDQ